VGKGTLLCPPPTDGAPMDPADPEGVERSAPPGPRVFRWTVTVGFTHGYSCCSPAGSTERSNLFGSHWSNQWLTLLTVTRPKVLTGELSDFARGFCSAAFDVQRCGSSRSARRRKWKSRKVERRTLRYMVSRPHSQAVAAGGSKVVWRRRPAILLDPTRKITEGC